ncbi:MAG: transposase, partial [candidate division KSB1 bacterium]|nr:transposase [candidate division KSB1 bacterium]
EDCVYCPVRNACLTNRADLRRGYRTIEDDAYAPLRHAMRTKIKSPEGRALYRRRGSEIEPRFGWLKRITLPQFRLRGLMEHAPKWR